VPVSSEFHKIKTKIRRLYDIANVLQALNLIEKTSLINRKPGFKWLGSAGFNLFIRSQRRKAENPDFDENSSPYISLKGIKKRNESKGKLEPVFVVSKPELKIQQITPPTAPHVKHFRPRVIQAISPFKLNMTNLMQREASPLQAKKRLRLDLCDSFCMGPRCMGKENVNISLHTPKFLSSKSSAFTKLDALLQVVGNLETKPMGRPLKKRPLMESQAINVNQ